MSLWRQSPMAVSWYRAPTAWEASSITKKPYWRDRARISAMSQGRPEKCTGTTIFGKRPPAAARASLSANAATLMLRECTSISTKSTSAPQ
jgi:hypothetical protein